MSKDLWWIEYMEGELDPSLKEDLEFLLKKSKSNQERLEEVQALRQWVSSADIADSLWDEKRFAQLHSKIMDKIEKKKKPRRRLWRTNSTRASV